MTADDTYGSVAWLLPGLGRRQQGILTLNDCILRFDTDCADGPLLEIAVADIERIHFPPVSLNTCLDLYIAGKRRRFSLLKPPRTSLQPADESVPVGLVIEEAQAIGSQWRKLLTGEEHSAAAGAKKASIFIASVYSLAAVFVFAIVLYVIGVVLYGVGDIAYFAYKNHRADSAWERGDYETARPLYLSIADVESSIIYRRLGHIYYEGRSVEPDPGQAASWYLESLRVFPEQPHLHLLLAGIFSGTLGGKVDIEQAIHHAARAQQLGSDEGGEYLEWLLSQQDYVVLEENTPAADLPEADYVAVLPAGQALYVLTEIDGVAWVYVREQNRFYFIGARGGTPSTRKSEETLESLLNP